jgi:hypothetical protein
VVRNRNSRHRPRSVAFTYENAGVCAICGVNRRVVCRCKVKMKHKRTDIRFGVPRPGLIESVDGSLYPCRIVNHSRRGAHLFVAFPSTLWSYLRLHDKWAGTTRIVKITRRERDRVHVKYLDGPLSGNGSGGRTAKRFLSYPIDRIQAWLADRRREMSEVEEHGPHTVATAREARKAKMKRLTRGPEFPVVRGRRNWLYLAATLQFIARQDQRRARRPRAKR